MNGVAKNNDDMETSLPQSDVTESLLLLAKDLKKGHGLSFFLFVQPSTGDKYENLLFACVRNYR